MKSAQRLGLSLGEVKETLAFRERDERPCQYVAGLIDERLGEVNQRLRELRAFKRELTHLRERMRDADNGVVERDAPYCHYIQDSPQAA
ncbi:MAG: MerR family DNA-binding protein [Actinomycetota bacterium]|nr:MerR family DNA-binding protein [Actinomycetota bacterium]